jgi:hypothetical protein
VSRWFLAGGLLVVLLACKAKSYTPSNGDDGDDGGSSGDDDGGPCTCVVPVVDDSGDSSNVTFACGGTACVAGTSYLCTATGTALPSGAGACGPGSDAGNQEEGECVPSCTGLTCNVPDMCGGTCQCAADVPCNPNGTCGNGRATGPGDVCLLDGGSASTCCSSGLQCLSRDSGATACCSPAGGTCSQSTDCCDYPAGTCSATGTCG